MEVERLKRVFKYKGQELPDPDHSLSTSEVKSLLSGTWPELINAKVQGPEIKDGKQIFSFSEQLGSKG